jgi:hypothetical protein
MRTKELTMKYVVAFERDATSGIEVEARDAGAAAELAANGATALARADDGDVLYVQDSPGTWLRFTCESVTRIKVHVTGI